jgi:hypothetical protein
MCTAGPRLPACRYASAIADMAFALADMHPRSRTCIRDIFANARRQCVHSRSQVGTRMSYRRTPCRRTRMHVCAQIGIRDLGCVSAIAVILSPIAAALNCTRICIRSRGCTVRAVDSASAIADANRAGNKQIYWSAASRRIGLV